MMSSSFANHHEEDIIDSSEDLEDDDDDEEEEDDENEPIREVEVDEEDLEEDSSEDEDDDDDDNNDDDDDESADDPVSHTAVSATLLSPGSHSAAGATAVVARAADDNEDDDEDDESGEEEEDLPLATPYPWAEKDYELTLHHEHKTRKQFGSGSLYLKRLVKAGPDASGLTSKACKLIAGLLKQKKKLSKSDDSDESDDEDDADEDGGGEDDQAKRKRQHLPGPRFWLKHNSTMLPPPDAQNNAGYLARILEVVQQYHPQAVSTRHLIRTCCLKLPPGHAPGNMDGKEMILAALHFLSSGSGGVAAKGWTSPDPSQLPTLPLLQVADSNVSNDMEKRNYAKVGKWVLLDEDDESEIEFRRALQNLEQVFFAAPQPNQWISRVRYCPRFKTKLQDEGPLLLKGNIPARLLGKKYKPATGTTTSQNRKRKTDALADAAATT